MFKPLAIIPVYNEVDILPWTMNHLLDQGCDIYIVDNWSTDGSYEVAKSFKVMVERWPDFALKIFDHTGILKRIEEVALKHKDRWIILQDADEIRRCPDPGGVVGDSTITIAEYLEQVTSQGYNAVRYKVVTFSPVDNTYKGDPENHFKYYTLDALDAHIAQVKTWFQKDYLVNIHDAGGHEVVMPERKIYPEPFILKHYPIRTIEQGSKKIFKDRKPRYAPLERLKNWHVQYDNVENEKQLIADPSTLLSL